MPTINRNGPVIPLIQQNTETNYDYLGHWSTSVSRTTLAHRAFSTYYKSWQTTANFKSLRAGKALLPDLPFSHYRRSTVCTALEVEMRSRFPGSFPPNYTTSTTNVFWYGAHPSYVEPSLSDSGSGQYTAPVLLKLIQKAKSNQVNLPVFLAEGRKTSEMVVRRATGMVNAIRAVRRGNFQGFLQHLEIDMTTTRFNKKKRAFDHHYGKEPSKAASNAWLEYSYGWIPFMMEVRSGVNTVMDLVDNPGTRVGTVRVSHNYPVKVVTNPSFNYQQSPFNLKGTLVEEEQWSVRAIWRYTTSTLDQPGRFGLTNPAEVAWELLPFSFVADWFVPIGDYLAALDAPNRFIHQGGTLGTRVWRRNQGSYLDSSDTRIVRISGGDWKSEMYNVTRSPITSVPIPSLLNLWFTPDIGAARAISSIALLRQQLSRLAK